jgi:predicted DNA-binding protein
VARPKIYYGGNVGVRLSRELDIRLRAASLESGRSLADIIREALMKNFEKTQNHREMRSGQ